MCVVSRVALFMIHYARCMMCVGMWSVVCGQWYVSCDVCGVMCCTCRVVYITRMCSYVVDCVLTDM